MSCILQDFMYFDSIKLVLPTWLLQMVDYAIHHKTRFYTIVFCD